MKRKDETFVGTRVLSLALSQSIVKTGYVVFFTLSLNLALFRLIVAINKRAVNVFFSTATTKSLHYLCIWNVITVVWFIGDLRPNKFFCDIVKRFGFCSCCGHPAVYCLPLP